MISIPEIKKYLKDNKITYIKLSEMSGIPIGSLRNIFSGRVPNPRIDTMNAIINALGIQEKTEDKPRSKSLEYLISDLRNMPPERQEELKPIIEQLIKAINK